MALIDTPPPDLASTNELDKHPDDLLEIPPAYYKFGISPSAMTSPMKQGDTEVLMVRVRCKEEHGPLERGDGELRYERTMKIQAIWKPGQPEPPDADAEQPALFDGDGEPTEDEAVGE